MSSGGLGCETTSPQCLGEARRTIYQEFRFAFASASWSALAFKSPWHTGRIRHLLKLYPKTPFVYIHRDTIEIFISSAQMWGRFERVHLASRRNSHWRVCALRSRWFGWSVEARQELGGSFLPKLDGESVKVFSASSPSSYPKRLRKQYCENNLKTMNATSLTIKLDDDLLQDIKMRLKVQFERYKYPSPCWDIPGNV
jgi:hypothetical protein